MKRFLVDILVLLTLTISVMAALEYSVRRCPTSYKIKEQWMDKNAEDVEILFCGPSNIYYGVRPDLITRYKSFNLANVSESYDYTYWMISHFSERYKKLKYIVVSISYYSLPYDRIEVCDPVRSAYYRIYNNCNYYPHNLSYSFETFFWDRSREKLKNYLAGRKINCDEFGFANDYTLERKQSKDHYSLLEDTKRWVDSHTNYNQDNVRYNLSYLDKIITYCEKENVSCVLVTPPVWHTYYDSCDKRQLAQMYESIDYLKEKHPSIKYMDYFQDSRFLEDDFYDPCHLTDCGAVKFTKLLDSIIE